MNGPAHNVITTAGQVGKTQAMSDDRVSVPRFCRRTNAMVGGLADWDFTAPAKSQTRRKPRETEGSATDSRDR